MVIYAVCWRNTIISVTLKAGDIMGKNPRSINADAITVEALETMRKNNISQLLVIDNNRYAGVVHFARPC